MANPITTYDPSDPTGASLIKSTLTEANIAAFQQATVTLSSAQLLALHSTPVQIVPAPGVGFYIAPSYYYMQLHFGTVAYAGSGNCSFIYGGYPVVNPTNLLSLYGWAAATSGIIIHTSSCQFIGICGEGLVPYTTCGNAAVNFAAPPAVTGGNGTLTIVLNYSVLPLP
jgi:hypothetical protein